MKTLLIPFDFSKASENALKYSVEFAMHEKPILKIYLLHLIDEHTSEDNAHKKLKSIINEYDKPEYPEIEPLVKRGRLTTLALALRQELQIDLVIVGTRGTEVFRKDMTSNTSKFIREVDMPVLVIPEKSQGFNLRNIVLTTGEEKIPDRNVLFTLLEIARRFNAKVNLLTIGRDKKMMGDSEYDEFNEKTIEYFLEMFYSHHTFIANEDIVEGINQYLEKQHIDMLAIMPKTHLAKDKASQGKLTNILTIYSEKPLLILD